MAATTTTTAAQNTTHNATNSHEADYYQPKSDADVVHGDSDHGRHIPAVPKAAKRDRFSYFKTKHFWITLALGQVLSLCITGTNTLSSLLAAQGTSIPAFQSMLNYALLTLIYMPYTIYKYGFKGYFRMIIKDGWRYLILSFFDVQGNYFVVLGYRYATILSLQLINFWAIVVVVAISLIFLRVRYHITQYVGILVCIGGMGILFGSDKITGANNFAASNQLKGNLFALAGATFYGFTNIFEEFLVSKKPMYEVVGQLGLYGMIISGVQTAIFDRPAWRSATWNADVGGYLTGYTLCLSIFYSLAPLLFRLSSAAFFNISLLTANFWGVCVGVEVLGLKIHWMYPIAFVCILLGLFVYFISESVFGEAKKPWLGAEQEEGVDGLGTARRLFRKQQRHGGGGAAAAAVATHDTNTTTVESRSAV